MIFLDGPPWGNIYAMVGTLTAAFGLFSWLVVQILKRNFVSHGDHVLLGRRVGDAEKLLSFAATKQDLSLLEARLRPVEQGVAVLTERVQSVQAGVDRTEHMVSLLVEHQMKREGVS